MKHPSELPLSANAEAVLQRRYLLKDKAGRVIETPRELFLRVASFIAEADRRYGADDQHVGHSRDMFYALMSRLDFLPNSPTLMNAGKELGQLSACFVLPVGDSMEEIFETNKNAALIHKSGGGTGFSFSRLRPKGAMVASTSGVASGPVSFMKVYNASTQEVKQGGTRRGANMGILRVDHPDIREFITCKQDTSQITNFNISVAATNHFMDALAAGKTYPLIDPVSGAVYKRDGVEVYESAREIFDLIVEQAWRTGEPGLIFLDRMNERNPTRASEIIEATNPCGEQPLPAYDSCNLGSLNLGNFVGSPLPESYSRNEPEAGIDWKRLGDAVRTAVHFLDNVIDQNKYPIPEIAVQSAKNRRIGLGVMGWADMLVKLGLPYNDTRSFGLAGRVMEFVESEAIKQSSELAARRGKFPNWDGSIYREQNVAMRNATVTTVAPTGTISIIAGCSSGIEPYYAVAFERNVMDGTRLVDVNPLFERFARQEGFYSDELMQRVSEVRSISGIADIPESVRALFVTAADVSPEDHIRMQAAFQANCDSSVSKTINFPESAGREEVRRAYELAWETGCKGVTIYRDNSRPDQVLSTGARAAAEGGDRKPLKRPLTLSGVTEKIQTGYGNLYVTVNLHDGKPFEVFAHIGKSGYTTMADTEAICRLISLALRSGVPVSEIIRQLRGIGGSQPILAKGGRVSSIPDAIAQILNRRFADSGESAETSRSFETEICPQCSSAMRFDGGCFTCQSCGYSNC